MQVETRSRASWVKAQAVDSDSPRPRDPVDVELCLPTHLHWRSSIFAGGPSKYGPAPDRRSEAWCSEAASETRRSSL
eukprot:1224512-Prymnesium_polylepis.1